MPILCSLLSQPLHTGRQQRSHFSFVAKFLFLTIFDNLVLIYHHLVLYACHVISNFILYVGESYMYPGDVARQLRHTLENNLRATWEYHHCSAA